MKKIFSSPDTAEVALLKNMLADAGVVCEVRDGALSHLVPFFQELWVADEDHARAAELVASWQRPAPATVPRWTCPSCGELIEAQFSSCWKCGAPRDTAVV
jgi:hypothetical protein